MSEETATGRMLRLIAIELKDKERDDIISCIRSSTWSGTEEIVAMIRARKDKP